MLDFSTEFMTQIANDKRDYLLWISIKNKKNKTIELRNANIWENTFSINDATSAIGTFTVGASVSTSFKVTINNIYEDYTDYDFLNAEVVPYIGMVLPSGSTERKKLGHFYCEEASYNGSTIDLVCTDYMSRFDRPYSESSLVYPATLQQIVADACNVCGVVNNTKQFDNCNFKVATRPEGNSLTFREVISCCAQIAGCFAKIDTDGRLIFNWYDLEFLARDDLDGGTFDTNTTPYSDGDDADGGNFKDYTGGDWWSGGTFLDMRNYHIVQTFNSLSTSMDDIVITGFEVTAYSNEETPDTASYGTDDYKISVAGNCLILDGYADEVCKFLFNKMGGMRFRNFDATIPNNPAIEAGDVGYFLDRKGHAYKCFFSIRTFTVGSNETLSCDAESPVRNAQADYSVIAKTFEKAREVSQAQITAYNTAIQNLTTLMSQSFGIFKTEEIQEDGSAIYTLHNKQRLEDSTVCWRMTAGALAVGTRKNPQREWQWQAGIDSSGNAVVNVLSAIGINADWINVGTLSGVTISGNTLTGNYINNGNGTFVVDANGNLYAKSGTFTGDVSSARLGGGAGATVQQAIDSANQAIAISNQAIANAQQAIASANQAIAVAQATANQAQQTAVVANNASAVANQAARTAQSTANSAQSDINNVKAGTVRCNNIKSAVLDASTGFIFGGSAVTKGYVDGKKVLVWN